MKENKYDDPVFFEKYGKMSRSVKGLSGAGEWQTLEKMLPDFKGKKVLDLGCGFGWHCAYASDNGAASVIGADISEKMLGKARELNGRKNVVYIRTAIEDAKFEEKSFDVVLSSLSFHYIQNFGAAAEKIASWLTDGGIFVFSAEHPVFTAEGSEQWLYENDAVKCFPVDNYFYEGARESVFLGEKVTKYHRTLTTYLKTLLEYGFIIEAFEEPYPPKELLPEMLDEMRRPMMFIVRAKKK